MKANANDKKTKKYTNRQIMEALWNLLDNIDTLSDICKPTIADPKAAMAFYNNAMKYAAKRFDYMKSDGYKLFTIEQFKKIKQKKYKSSLLQKHNTDAI